MENNTQYQKPSEPLNKNLAMICGTIIVGAQPYSAFKVIIDEQLKKLGK